MKLQFKSMIVGVLVGALCMAQLPILAAQGTKNLSVMYNNIKLFIDQKEVKLKGANGKVVEPFTYEGNTYVPLEALADQLNLYVSSSGNTLTLSSTPTSSDSIINEFENNDTTNSANVIEPTSTVVGNIGSKNTSLPSDRTDWFKVTIPSTGTFNLGLVGGPDQYLYLTLFTQSGEDEIVSVSEKDSKLSIAQPIEAGTYYIRIQTPPSQSAQPYRLTTSFKGISTPSDPVGNDSKAKATTCKLGKATSGNLGYTSAAGTTDSDDWYTFTVDSNKAIKLSLKLSADLNARMTVYTANGDASIIDLRGQNQVLTTEKFLTKGTYYVQLKQLKGAGSYTLTAAAK